VAGEPDVGDLVGGYRLQAALGEGAMGSVFRAERTPDGVAVAVKVLKAALANDDVYRQRFVHEARAAQAVTHPALVPVIDAGEDAGHHYLVMAYWSGRTLKQRIEADGPLSASALVEVMSPIGAGLDALHESGLVHRDVKPSNILLDDRGAAALTDFGIARGRAYTVLTRPGQLLGTPDYMAPELIRGTPADTASDVYSLGCVGYECITGEPPFAHRAAFQLGFAHLREEPPDPAIRRPDLPSELFRAILKALVKDPDRRPHSAGAYADLIRVVLRRTAP
jgi:serine/threonine-protein kinase